MDLSQPSLSRRRLLSSAASAAPMTTFGILGTLSSHAKSAQRTGPVVGEGEHRYEVIHDWVTLPDRYSWQITHNVAIDRDGNLYVIHEGQEDLPDHPAIFVFDADGKFVKAFGQQFQGGGHGIEVRTEGGEQFLYVAAYQKLKTIAKLTLDGEEVWSQKAPLESGAYPDDENTRTDFSDRSEYWGRNHFLPTNFAFLPDGGFFAADGYGAHMIHRYDGDAQYVSSFGGSGTEDGQFKTPHGLWIDSRGEQDLVVVADRANKRLQWFTLGGEHRRTLDGFILPANIDQLGDTLLVPDLSARITLLDRDDNLIHLGEDPAWREQVLADRMAMRRGPSANWMAGRFLHPHDACFTPEGDIYVAEWVASGRISKLRRVS